MAGGRNGLSNAWNDMVKEIYALLTGLFVLALGAAMVAMGFFLGDYGRESDVYVVTTRGAVSGLNPESVVIYRGVKAGKVTRIRFDPEDMQNILVRIELDQGLPITRGTYATLRMQPLTGLAQVELNDAGTNPEPLPSDADHPARIPLRPSFFDKLTESGGDILAEVTRLTQRLNALLGEENQGYVQNSLKTLDQAATELVTLERRFGAALDRLPAADQRLQNALAEHASAARSVRETSERVGQLAAQAEELVSQGKTAATALVEERLPEFRSLLDELKQTAANVRKLSATLERDPQALLLGPAPPPPGPGEPGYQESP